VSFTAGSRSRPQGARASHSGQVCITTAASHSG
jgi:hypothetical protein